MEIPISILDSYIPCLIGYKPLEGRAVHSRSASSMLLEARALASHEDHSQYLDDYIPLTYLVLMATSRTRVVRSMRVRDSSRFLRRAR